MGVSLMRRMKELEAENAGAQTTLERLLQQFSDFLPGVKLAKLISVEFQNWDSAAKWYAAEIELSHVPQIVSV